MGLYNLQPRSRTASLSSRIAGIQPLACAALLLTHTVQMMRLISHNICSNGDSFRCSLPRSGFIHCSSIQLIESELASFTSGIAVLCLRGCVSTIVFSVSRVSSARGRRQAASAWACQRGQLLGSFRLHRCYHVFVFFFRRFLRVAVASCVCTAACRFRCLVCSLWVFCPPCRRLFCGC
jgi:hypothetical protein